MFAPLAAGVATLMFIIPKFFYERHKERNATDDELVRQPLFWSVAGMSLFSGGFLIFAGILGCTAPVLGGGLVYFIGSIYAILFGAIVMTIEVKDKTKFVSAFYHWLDTYLKFLTFQV